MDMNSPEGDIKDRKQVYDQDWEQKGENKGDLLMDMGFLWGMIKSSKMNFGNGYITM